METLLFKYRTQNLAIILFDINYNRKIICISQEIHTKTRYIVDSAEATLQYIETFNYFPLKCSHHYIFKQKM